MGFFKRVFGGKEPQSESEPVRVEAIHNPREAAAEAVPAKGLFLYRVSY